MEYQVSQKNPSPIQEYFENQFPSDLQKINFQMPNSVVQNFLNEQGTPFFGGSDWKHCREDLERLSIQNRHFFILSIFMIVLTDQCLYRYQKDLYAHWREQTYFPKFGWVGFGVHNENPFKLLWIPERDAIVDIQELVSSIPDFIELFKYKIATYFPGIVANSFFENIRHDAAYSFNEGFVLKAFKSEFEKEIFLNTK